MAEMVTIFANGKARQVRSSQTVSEMIRDMKLAPSSVLVERNGEALLRHEWAERKVEHGDRLDCVFRINNDSIDSIFAQEFVKSRKCPELSLSYAVTMQNSTDGFLTGGGKDMIEVSIVKSGARDNCLIRGFT